MEKVEDVCSAPQLTFSEGEHGDMVKFINIVSTCAKFDGMDLKRSHELAALHVKAVNIVKKMESHIFEVKRVTNTKKAD